MAMLWLGLGDLHGRAGDPDVHALGAVQAAAQVHGDVAVGPSAAGRLRRDDPDHRPRSAAGRARLSTSRSATGRRAGSGRRRRRRRNRQGERAAVGSVSRRRRRAAGSRRNWNAERPIAPAEPKRLVRAEDAEAARRSGARSRGAGRGEAADAEAAATVEAAGRSSPGEPAEAIEAPPAQRREAAPPAVPGDADDCRTRGRATRRPSRSGHRPTTCPAALLQQIVPLPKMTEQRCRSNRSATIGGQPIPCG